MDLGVLEIWSGSQPASAEDAESGSVLVRITDASATYTETGAGTNGLTFASGTGGAISKTAAQVWSGAASATGTAGWFRFYAKAYDVGVDSGDESFVRMDGQVGTSGAQLNLHSLSIVSGATTTIDQFTLTDPES